MQLLVNGIYFFLKNNPKLENKTKVAKSYF